MWPIITIAPHFVLYSYPLLMGFAWGLGYHFAYAEALSLKWSPRFFKLFFFGIFFASWIGAKLFFILTYPDSLQGDLASSSNFWLGGGFVFYGGLLFGLGLVLLLKFFNSKIRKVSLAGFVVPLALGHAVGRVGCFLAGCCYGKEADSLLTISMHGHYRYPVQLFEAIAVFFLGVFLLKKKHHHSPYLLSYYLLIYGPIRFGLEFLRGDDVRGAWGILSPSQWVSLALMGLGVAVLFSTYTKLKKG